jgi:hypothetical protein
MACRDLFRQVCGWRKDDGGAGGGAVGGNKKLPCIFEKPWNAPSGAKYGVENMRLLINTSHPEFFVFPGLSGRTEPGI